MTCITYSNNTKIQVELTNDNFVEDSWLLLIKKFLDIHNFENICKSSVSKFSLKSYHNSKFSNFDLFLQEIFMTLSWYRELTKINFIKENKIFSFILDNIALKSSLNNFQNSFSMKDSFEFTQLTINFLKQFPHLLLSSNWMFIFDSDAVDIETHWKQEGSYWHWYYRQTMYYPDIISVCDWTIPIAWRLRAWNSHWWNWDLQLLQEIFASLSVLDTFSFDKVLVRWDSAFWNDAKFSYMEEKWWYYLIRISSNERLKKICNENNIDIYTNRNFCTTIKYKADSWSKERTVIVNIVEKKDKLFPDVQFFCTNLWDSKKYDITTDEWVQKIIELYHQRWTSEHIFHDFKESFQAWQTSSHKFYTNSYKFQVSIIAMQIYIIFRKLYLKWIKEYENSYYSTIYINLISLVWKIVYHARKIILKIPQYSKRAQLFINILERLEAT